MAAAVRLAPDLMVQPLHVRRRSNGTGFAVVEACMRELLGILAWPGHVRPYDRSRPLNITFYTNCLLYTSPSPRDS